MTLADRPETPLTRREQQREATYGEIVRVSRALLDEGANMIHIIESGSAALEPASPTRGIMLLREVNSLREEAPDE